MTITVLNPQGNETGAAASNTLSAYNSQSSGTGILVVGVEVEEDGTTRTIDSVTFDGSGSPVALTQGPSIIHISGFSNRVEIWYLFSPDGVGDIVATFDAAADGSCVVAVVLEGAELQAPEATSTATDPTAPIDTSITTITANAMIIDAFGNNNANSNTVTQGPDQIEEVECLENSGFQSSLSMSSRLATSAQGYTLGWSGAWNRGAHVLTAWKEVAGIPTTYFVKNLGDNSKTGLTDDDAWKTIGKVNVPGLTYNDGDIIQFKRDDEWNVNDDAVLTPPDDGSSGSPITFRAYGSGANPRIYGGTNITGVTGDWSEPVTNKWTRTVTGTPAIVVLDSVMGVEATSQANVTQSPEWFHTGTTLTVWSTQNPATEFTRIDLAVTADESRVLLLIARDWLTFKDLHFTVGRNFAVHFSTTVSTNITFTDCEFGFFWENGFHIQASSNNITISGGSVHDCGTFQINGSNDNAAHGIDILQGAGDITIDGVELSKNSSSHITNEQDGGNNITVNNCNLHGGEAFCINIKVGTGHVISDNIIDGAPDSGHVMENGTDFGDGVSIRGIGAPGVLTLKDNVIKNCGRLLTIGGSASTDTITLTSERNTFMDSKGWTAGSLVQGGDGAETNSVWDCTFEADIFIQRDFAIQPSNTKGIVDINRGRNFDFIHCTFHDSRAAGGFCFKQDGSGGDDLTTLVLKNCSFFSIAGIPLHYQHVTAEAIDTVHLERDGTTDFVEIVGGSNYDESDIPAAWNSAESGVTGTHVTGPPLFDSTTQTDGTFMQPGGGSPLIGAGVTGVAPANDNKGISYETPPNIGARSQGTGAGTKDKRLQFLEFGGGYSWHTLFNPDGSIISGDRGHILGLYNLQPTPGLDITLGDVRLAPVLYSGFRPHDILPLAGLHSISSIVTTRLSITRGHDLSIPIVSTIAATLDTSDQIFFVATVSSSAAISPSLDVNRGICPAINSLSLITVGGTLFKDLGNIQIVSISTIIVPLFGEFVSDLGTIRLSPMSSPGFDFFVPPAPDIPFTAIISNISAMLPTLSVTKGVDGSIDSVSILVASMSTETVTFGATIASIGIVGA